MINKMICTNCGIHQSAQWRPIKKEVHCNACAIHVQRKHKEKYIHEEVKAARTLVSILNI